MLLYGSQYGWFFSGYGGQGGYGSQGGGGGGYGGGGYGGKFRSLLTVFFKYLNGGISIEQYSSYIILFKGGRDRNSGGGMDRFGWVSFYFISFQY